MTSVCCRAVAVFAVVVAAILVAATPSMAADKDAPKSLTATLDGPFAMPKGTIALVPDNASKPLTLTVRDTASFSKLALAAKGDRVTIDVDNPEAPTKLVKLVWIARPVSMESRIAALSLAALVLLLLAAAVTHWQPMNFVIGTDNRYSNSQTQLALWFGAVAAVYAAAVALRMIYFDTAFIGGVGFPAHVIEVTGLSALSFGGAKVITAQKVADAASKGLPPAKTTAARANLLSDLVSTDSGQADLGDFQMILVTLAAVIIFMMSSIQFLGLLTFDQQVVIPDIDSALLAGFGVGQGAYLVKKAALKVGEG